MRHLISILVPVWNEVALLGTAMERLLQQEGEYEVIVADGGSTDGTCEVVQQFPVMLVRQPDGVLPGLGSQINRAAAHATGDILLFLHIDVELPPHGIQHIESVMREPQYIGGGFLPKYSGPVPDAERQKLLYVQRAWQWRTQRFSWFVGDSAPFLRSQVFNRSGGYPPAGFASDWDFANKMRRLGPLALIREPASVSSRRLVQNGILKSLLVTGSVELMYHMGADRKFLRNWYRRWLSRER